MSRKNKLSNSILLLFLLIAFGQFAKSRNSYDNYIVKEQDVSTESQSATSESPEETMSSLVSLESNSGYDSLMQESEIASTEGISNTSSESLEVTENSESSEVTESAVIEADSSDSEVYATQNEYRGSKDTDSFNVEPVENYEVYTQCNLRLRIGPSTDYEQICVVKTNTRLTVTGVVNNWVRIFYNDVEAYCSAKYISTEKYVEKVATKEIRASPSSDVKSSLDNYIKGEDDTTSKVVEIANNYWNKNVPDSIRQWVISNNWKIVISNQSLEERFKTGFSTAGLTYYNGVDNVIYLDNRKSTVSRALIHEIGHAINYTCNAGVDSEEFIQIFEEEKNQFTDCTGGSDYARSSVNEYFASVFANIILDYNSVSKNCPKSVAYINNFVPN